MAVFLGLFVFLAYALTQALREARRQREAREFEAIVVTFLSAVVQVVEHLAANDREHRPCGGRCADPFDAFRAERQDGARGGGPCSS
jgi:hypothetical protein